MAEVTGQIGQEYVELDNAATEATLIELLNAVVSLSKKTNTEYKTAKTETEKLAKALDGARISAIRKSMADRERIAESKRQINQERKNDEDKEKDEKKLDEQRKKREETRKKVLIKFNEGMKNTIGIISDIAGLGDSLSGTAQLFGKIPIVGGVLGAAFGAVTQAAEKTHAAFVKTSSVGANFNGSVISMINSASEAGLTFDQFSDIIAKNAEGLALFGAGTAEGAKRFSRLGKEMKSVVVDSGLADLGYTTESANDAMAKYMGQLAKTGSIKNLTDQQLVASTAGYLKNLDAVSKLTGKSKDALQAESDARMNDAKMRVMLAGTDADTHGRVNSLLNALPKGLQAGATEVLATGTATTEAGRQFLVAMGQSGTDLIELGNKLKNGGKLSEEAMIALSKQIQSDATAFSKSPMAKTAGTYLEGWNEIVVASMDIAQQEKSLGELILKQREDEANNTDKTAAELVAAKQAVAKISNDFMAELTKFLPQYVKLLKMAVATFQQFLDWFTENKQSIMEFARYITDIGLGVWEVWKGLLNIDGNSVVDNIKALGAAAFVAAGVLTGIKAISIGTAIATAIRGVFAKDALTAATPAASRMLSTAALTAIAIPVVTAVAVSAGAAWLFPKITNSLASVDNNLSTEKLLQKLDISDLVENPGEFEEKQRANIWSILNSRGIDVGDVGTHEVERGWLAGNGTDTKRYIQYPESERIPAQKEVEKKIAEGNPSEVSSNWDDTQKSLNKIKSNLTTEKDQEKQKKDTPAENTNPVVKQKDQLPTVYEPNQNNPDLLTNSVNTKLDELISLTARLADLNSKQLSVQKAFGNDIIAST